MRNREDVLNILFIWVVTALGYQRLRAIDIVAKLEYWNYAPNRYRLFHQFLLLLHDDPFSIVTLITFSFGLCMTATYLIIKPTGRDLSLFLLGVLLVGGLGYGYNAIMYPILALIGKYNDRRIALLLIPLALVKEFAFFVAVLFLLSYSKNKFSTLICGGLGTVSYLVVRFLILGDVGSNPGSAPLFTLFYMLDTINLWFFGLGCCVIIIMALTTIKTKDEYLVIATAIIACSLALWWEPQLWLPTMVLILAERKRSEEQ